MRFMNKRKFQPDLAGLEGRLLLSTAPHMMHQPHHMAAQVGRAQSGEMSSIHRTAAPTVTTLSDISDTAPAIAQFNGKTFLAFTGTNGFLNVESSSDGVHFGNKVTLPDNSSSTQISPALAAFDGRLYIAWTGGFNELNIESSSDGVHFGNKVTLSETSKAAPTLAAFNGRLYLGWTGLDSRLNLISTPDGIDFGRQVILNQRSYVIVGNTLTQPAPALAAYRGQLWIAYVGSDSGHHINLMCSSDGVNFSAPVQTTQASLTAPALTVVQSATPKQPACLVLGWTGIQNNWINYMTTTTNATGFSGAVTTSDVGVNGVAIDSRGPGKLDFGWSGFHSANHLRVMELSV